MGHGVGMIEGIRLENGETWQFGGILGRTRLLLHHRADHCFMLDVISIFRIGMGNVPLMRWHVRRQEFLDGDPMQKITNEINDFLYARFGSTFSKREASND